jgi:uncharacterized membrane protein YbhN (UPF0104 family)
MRELSRAAVVQRLLGRALPAAAGVAVIAVLAWRLGTGPFLRAVTSATVPSLALALALGAVTTGLSALRWCRAARLLWLPLQPARALGDYYVALFLNSVLPGGVLGDVRRAALHGRDVGSRRNATTALLLERSAGQLVLMVVAAVVWLVDPGVIPGPDPGPGWRVGAAAVGVVLFAAAVPLARILPLRGLRDVAAMLGASLVVLAGHLAMFVLAARTAGVSASVLVLLPLALVALLAMSLPFNLAGWGPREGATAWVFAGAGLGAGRGLAVAVLYGVFALVASLPGALMLAARTTRPRIAPLLVRRLDPGRQPGSQEDVEL